MWYAGKLLIYFGYVVYKMYKMLAVANTNCLMLQNFRSMSIIWSNINTKPIQQTCSGQSHLRTRHILLYYSLVVLINYKNDRFPVLIIGSEF